MRKANRPVKLLYEDISTGEEQRSSASEPNYFPTGRTPFTKTLKESISSLSNLPKNTPLPLRLALKPSSIGSSRELREEEKLKVWYRKSTESLKPYKTNRTSKRLNFNEVTVKAEEGEKCSRSSFP